MSRSKSFSVCGVPSSERPIGWSGIAQLVEMLEHHVVGRVLRRADLLHDHALLALQLVRLERGLARMSDSTSSASGTSAFSTRA